MCRPSQTPHLTMSSARIDPPKRVLGLKEGVVTPPPIHGVIGLESSSTGSSFPADSAKPVPLAVVSLDSRQGHDRRALLLIAAWLLPRRPGIGRALQRHPFSGLRAVGHRNPASGSSRIASSAYQKWPTWSSRFRGMAQQSSHPSFAPIPKSDERFARQYRCGPPPEFPLALPRSGIVHHLSGPDRHAHTRTLLRRSRSVGCAPVRDPANQLPCALRVYSPVDSHTCQTPWSVPGLGHHLNPCRSTPRIDRQTGLLRSASDQDASPAPIRFPPDNFKHSLTLFSKSFSSLPRAPRGATGSGHNGALTLSGAPLQGTWARSVAEDASPDYNSNAKDVQFSSWALPGSLAVTKGILVSFFSSAY
ncbi:unnamed protein product [Brassica rapa subsp. trilocularis]